MIIEWSNLNNTQKEGALKFILSNSKPLSSDDQIERTKYLTGSVFNKGDTLLISFKESNIIGSLGIVTAEIPFKGKAYLTEININKNHVAVFEDMLKMAKTISSSSGAKELNIGIKPHNEFLIPIIVDSGFALSHKFIELFHDKENPSNWDNLVPLNEDNASLYAEIMTSAFSNIPNGATVSLAEALSLLDEPENNKYGIFTVKNVNIGAYELRIRDNIGWIDGIAVSPSYHGKGYGRLLLNQCMGYLYSQGVEKIHLMVADTNSNAYNLYLNSGFKRNVVLSTWFKKTID